MATKNQRIPAAKCKERKERMSPARRALNFERIFFYDAFSTLISAYTRMSFRQFWQSNASGARMGPDEIFGKGNLILGLLEMNNKALDIESDEKWLAESLARVRGTYVYSLMD